MKPLNKSDLNKQLVKVRERYDALMTASVSDLSASGAKLGVALSTLERIAHNGSIAPFVADFRVEGRNYSRVAVAYRRNSVEVLYDEFFLHGVNGKDYKLSTTLGKTPDNSLKNQDWWARKPKQGSKYTQAICPPDSSVLLSAPEYWQVLETLFDNRHGAQCSEIKKVRSFISNALNCNETNAGIMTSTRDVYYANSTRGSVIHNYESDNVTRIDDVELIGPDGFVKNTDKDYLIAHFGCNNPTKFVKVITWLSGCARPYIYRLNDKSSEQRVRSLSFGSIFNGWDIGTRFDISDSGTSGNLRWWVHDAKNSP